MVKKLNLRIWIVFLVGALVALTSWLFGIYVDYLEINEIGSRYVNVMLVDLKAKLLINGIGFMVILTAFISTNLLVRRNMLNRGNMGIFLQKKGPMIVLSVVMTYFATMLLSQVMYSRYLNFCNSSPFMSTDPIFGKDIGYYVFVRPFLMMLSESAGGIWLFLCLYTVIVYVFFTLQTEITSLSTLHHDRRVITHNITNIVIFFLLNSINYAFAAEDILFGEFSGYTGAGYTDITVWLKYYRCMPFVLVGLVIAAVYYQRKRQIKNTIVSIALYPAIFILFAITANLVQYFVVKPYEVSMEQKYLGYNNSFTREAYGISEKNVTEKEFPLDNKLTLADIKANKETIQNIRINDLNAALAATGSLQGLRNFYTFMDSDIVPYTINGKKTAMMLAAREIDMSKLPETAKSYINQKLSYTHGYGITMSPMNQVTSEGQPKFLIKDIPVKSFEGAPQVTQPRIYYGELTNDYVVVKSTYREIDYVEENKSVEYSYEGTGGVSLGFLNRLVFAIKNYDFMMLMSGYITPESRILTNRNVIERAKRAVPYLTYDDDPYIVVDDGGNLKWIIDAYTTTADYPYSQKRQGINYIRNCVKVVVDAFSGQVDFYITDGSDPIINTYDLIYKGVFLRDPLPVGLREHVRYSETLFKIQADMYKKYHVTDTETFFSNADVWVSAKEKYHSGETKDVEPYYNLMKLEDDLEEELYLMQPFAPQGKENLVAWISAGTEGGPSGNLTVYRFPKGQTVYGTLHIENKIDNDPNISKEISLWNTGGSRVIKGNMLVVPIKNSLLYVEPIYITTNNSAALPEVKRICVAFADNVAMEETIEKALEVLFGVEKPTFTLEEGLIEDLLENLISDFALMKNQLSENDLEAFGRHLKEYEKLIDQLEQRRAEWSQQEEDEQIQSDE